MQRLGLGDFAAAVGIQHRRLQIFAADIAVNLMFVNGGVQFGARSPFTGAAAL